MLRFKALVIVLVLLAPNLAGAADSGFYLGGSAGYSDFNQNDAYLFSAPPKLAVFGGQLNIAVGLPPGIPPEAFGPFSPGGPAFIPTTNIDIDDEDVGWTLRGGYNFNRHFGLEAAYIDFGEAQSEITSELVTPTIDTTIISTSTASASAFQISGIARIPVTDKIDLFGKLGGFFWEVETESKISVDTTGPVFVGSRRSVSTEDNGADMTFGAGLEFALMRQATIRAGWDRYRDIGDDGSNIDLFSIGINYHFDLWSR